MRGSPMLLMEWKHSSIEYKPVDWLLLLLLLLLIVIGLRHDVSYAEPNDPIARSTDRNVGIWMAWRRCACGSGGSIRRCGQSAIHSPPMSICMAFHLRIEEKKPKQQMRKVLVIQNQCSVSLNVYSDQSKCMCV